MVSLNSPLRGCALVLVLSAQVLGQSPLTKLSFQGYLTDNGGTPINNASQSMTFAMYKGATKIWQETQSVAVANGRYNVLLGSVVPVDTIRFNQPIELGVKVGADAEMTPRIPLASSALARSLPGLDVHYADNGFWDGYSLIQAAGVTHANPVAVVVLGGGIGPYANEALADAAAIGGGIGNKAVYSATVSGGSNNIASGNASTIGGGVGNTASGTRSTIPGGDQNRADGDYSFAAGYKARAKHEGSFVWNDHSVASGNDSLLSTAPNQFVVRAFNGVGVNKAPVSWGIHLKQRGSDYRSGIRHELDNATNYWDTYIDGALDYNFAYNTDLKAYIRDTDGSYQAVSDARLKEDVRPFEPVLDGVLQLRPSSYRFKDAAASDTRSVGFLAQEVESYFPQLVSEKNGLKTLNYDGFGVVAIKAIQELYAMVQAQQARLDQQEAELAAFRQAASRP